TAEEQQLTDVIERIALPTAVLQRLLLDPLAAGGHGGVAEPHDVERVNDDRRVGQRTGSAERLRRPTTAGRSPTRRRWVPPAGDAAAGTVRRSTGPRRRGLGARERSTCAVVSSRCSAQAGSSWARSGWPVRAAPSRRRT